MKKISKLLAVALALVLCVSLVPAVFAGSVTYTITVENATADVDYAAYKIFDVKPNTDYSSFVYTVSEANYTTYWSTVAESGPFNFAKAGDQYEVTLKTEQSSETVTEFFRTNIDGIKKVADTPVTGTYSAETKTSVINLTEAGYYYVTSSLGAVVSVTTTDPDAKVIDKNQKPGWPGDNAGSGKTVQGAGEGATAGTENSGHYGEKETFKITFNATNFDGTDQITNYFVKDTIGKGFTYDPDSLTVSVNDGDTHEVPKQENENGQGYRVSWNEEEPSFTLYINWLDENGNSQYASPATVTITYTATINEKAEINGTGNTNSAQLGWNTRPYDPEDPPTDPVPTPDPETETTPDFTVEDKSETTTYVFAAGIVKMDENGTGLTGAHFTMQDKDGNTIVVKATQDAKGNYIYAGTLATGSSLEDTPPYDSNSADYTIDLVSGEDGLITVEGIAEGTYTFTETEAPAGYNLLDGTFNVQGDLAGWKTSTTDVTYYIKDGQVVGQEEGGETHTSVFNVDVKAAVVINKTGTQLPDTGGIGTTVFYVVGGVLVLAAVVLLVTKKRMSNSKG